MSEDEYYTIRSAGFSDVPLRSRPRPLRAALLFATAAIAVTVLVVPELLDGSPRNPGWGRLVAERDLVLDDRAVGSLGPASRLPRWAQGDDVALRTGEAARRSQPGRSSTYTVRRSVLSEGSVCIIGQNGTRRGSC